MGKTVPAALAAVLVVGGLIMAPAVAGGDPLTSRQIGEPLAMTLSEAKDASGWANKVKSVLKAQGYDSAVVGKAYTGQGVTVDPAAGTIAVAPNASLNVGSAVADANGTWTLAADQVKLTLSNNNGLTLKADEVLAAWPPQEFTAKVKGRTGTGRYLIDWGANSGQVLVSSGSASADSDVITSLLGARSGIDAASYAQNMGNDMANQIVTWVNQPTLSWRDQVTWSYTFGQAFAGLTAGVEATLDPAGAVSSSWMAELTGSADLSGNLKNLKWSTGLSNAVTGQISSGTALRTSLNALSPSDQAWAALLASDRSLIDGRLDRWSGTIVKILNDDTKKMDGSSWDSESGNNITLYSV
ncbi:MAG: hypothetical protein LBL55_02290, partial [Propionibacteriaceae bacterium]|nr:hypothetical protein [Propionibacteriaceae bacterium]